MLLEQGGRGTRDGAKVIIIVGVGDFGLGCSVKIVGVIMSRALAFGRIVVVVVGLIGW
jgi:hypothetical protein